jgi:RNA polymerase sigma-70 factor (ECF subfamily)
MHSGYELTAVTKSSCKTSEIAAIRLAELVAKAKEGNRSAFSQLIDRFHQDIFRMVFFRIRSQMDAEDVTQDIFLQAFKNIVQLKTVAHFKSWIYRIALNRIRDFYRKKRIRSLISLFSDSEKDGDDYMPDGENSDPNPLTSALQNDFYRQLNDAMGNLSRMEKEVFSLRYLDDLGIKEIAQTLSKSESTIKTHLYRALCKIKNSKILTMDLSREMP